MRYIDQIDFIILLFLFDGLIRICSIIVYKICRFYFLDKAIAPLRLFTHFFA